MLNKARALAKKMSSKVASAIPENISSVPSDPPLKYKVIAKCKTTKARVGVMTLRHGDVDTPVFMPVGTQVGSDQQSTRNAFLPNFELKFSF